MPLARALRVAIVGLGPKGLFALERLVDHARALLPTERLAVDIFEPHPVPGAGAIYDPGQPAYLKMNFAADQLDMWWPGSTAVPPAYRRSFVEWRDALGIAAEAYPPRAQVGDYLAYGLGALLGSAPPNIGIRLHRARVETLRADRNGWQIHSAEGTGHYDEVLIATGHQACSNAALEHGWAHAAPLVPGVFPVDDRLGREQVAPGATVAIRGFALTFIDAALALTEGRGGSFEPLGDHPFRLRYLPGRDEIGTIFPFSRSGKPMLAKPGPLVTLRHPELHDIAEQGRARIARLPRPIDLKHDLAPILREAETESLRAVGGRKRSRALGPAAAIEQSLAIATGSSEPDAAWAKGHVWRALYPAIVSRLGDQGLAAADWPAFLRLAAERERLAFGPPAINAAKLLALIEARRIDLSHLQGGFLADEDGRTCVRSDAGTRTVDAVIDAVLPAPGALGDELLAALVASGDVRIARGRRGLDVTADGSCRAADGSVGHGLAAVGRPSEDSVIGNDTLSRSLHPQTDLWARRIVARGQRHAASEHAHLLTPA